MLRVPWWVGVEVAAVFVAAKASKKGARRETALRQQRARCVGRTSGRGYDSYTTWKSEVPSRDGDGSGVSRLRRWLRRTRGVGLCDGVWQIWALESSALTPNSWNAR